MATGGTLLVLHGPNLNLLGRREPALYGTSTLAEIDAELMTRARARNFSLQIHQSNREGELVDFIQAAEKGARGILINAAGYSHTSIAIYDALKAVALPAVEVHLSNVYARETFRHHSQIAGACIGAICGFGAASYYLGLTALCDALDGAKT